MKIFDSKSELENDDEFIIEKGWLDKWKKYVNTRKEIFWPGKIINKNLISK